MPDPSSTVHAPSAGAVFPPRAEIMPLIEVCIGGKPYVVDHGKLTDISRGPNADPEASLTAFGLPAAAVDTSYSVRGGMKCNCRLFSGYSPHLHGTHLETREHILEVTTSAIERIRGHIFVARLVTLTPHPAGAASLVSDPRDLILHADDLKAALSGDEATPEVLMIRTPNLPDPPYKPFNYGGTNPPYPHYEIARMLVERGVKHVVLDLPSADREVGELFFHRTFWQDGKDRSGNQIIGLEHLARATPRDDAAIVELAYFPDSLKDGWYIVYLAPIAFPGDAAPVRPLVAPLLNFPWSA